VTDLMILVFIDYEQYNVQNLDFDLSQFGLFLNNDIIFITVHYNDMIEQFGRKLIISDYHSNYRILRIIIH